MYHTRNSTCPKQKGFLLLIILKLLYYHSTLAAWWTKLSNFSIQCEVGWLYATSTFPIMHLICPQILYNLCFLFSWVLQPSQEKLKTMFMQNFGGQIRCIMGKEEVAYGKDCNCTMQTPLWIINQKHKYLVEKSNECEIHW